MTSRHVFRWWPVPAILAAGVLAILANQAVGEREGQERVLFTFGASLVMALLVAAWVLGFSPLDRRTRRLLAIGLVAALAVAAALVRVRGVTGDFVPVLEWRWTRATVLPAPASAAANGGGAPATPAAESSDVTLADASAAPAADASRAHDSRSDLDRAEDSAPDAGAPPGTPPTGAPEPAPARAAVRHASYPQFLGPDRNGVVRGIRLAPDWAAQPPRLVWRHPVGAAWSGFAVADGLAVTQEQRGSDEAVVAYDLHTGDVRWLHTDSERYATVVAGEGPRATPTISGGRVYTLGATGLLNALDLQTGRRIWQRHVVRENPGPDPDWGRSSSPLVLNGRVVVSVGGEGGRSLVAYDAGTGAPVWRGGDDAVGFSSPMVVTLAGRRQIVIFNRGSVAGHDPDTGARLWQHPWPAHQPTVTQPLPLGGDRLLVSSGYGIGSKLLRLTADAEDGLRAELLWESPRLKAKFTNLVAHEGFVYGLDDGVLVCLDPATGERRWRSGRYGHGQVILADDLLLVQTEEGEVVLVRPDPARHVELGRFTALEGKTWNPPALAGPLLLVRNDREAATYELPRAR
jgi:outer membrane protein assembly factor BamB